MAFASAMDNAVMESADVLQTRMAQYLNNPVIVEKFQKVIFDMLIQGANGR